VGAGCVCAEGADMVWAGAAIVARRSREVRVTKRMFVFLASDWN